MDAATTVDEVCRGELQLEQPRRGYRFNIDAVLLARFAAARARRTPQQLVDLGAGCGVVGLLLARAWPASRLTLVELQPQLAALCRRNVERNRLAERALVLEGDLREAARWAPAAGAASLAVCNPPYYPLGGGHVSEQPQIASARHELCCTLEQLVAACAAGLPPGGELALIHVASRSAELLAALGGAGFAVQGVRLVQAYADRPATRVLVHALRGPGALELAATLPPLVVNDDDQRYSAEVRAMLGEPA